MDSEKRTLAASEWHHHTAMNIIIADSEIDDTRYFPGALEGHQVATIHGYQSDEWPNVEAVAIVHGKPFGRDLLATMPKLRLIVTRSTGYDHIDLEAAAERGIEVCNIPDYGSTSVAEFTLGLILSLTRKIPHAVANSRRGGYTVDELMGIDLEGKTLGIVGLGKIGRKVARMAQGFSMKVIASDPYREGTIPLETLLATADVVALCCRLTPGTHHLLNAETIALMKPSAYLVNTSRGSVVDSAAVLSAVDSGRLAGAALDVMEGEDALAEMKVDSNVERNLALMKHRNILVTPHLAYDTAEAVHRIREATAEILRAFAEGRVLHAVPRDSIERVTALSPPTGASAQPNLKPVPLVSATSTGDSSIVVMV